VAPPAVAEVETHLAAWGNAYAATAPDSAPEGRAETVLFVGAAAQHLRPQTLAAARRLLEQLGIAYQLVGVGRASAYLPFTLGLWDTARRLAQATVDEIEAAGARRLLVLSAEDAHAFRHLHGRLRLDHPALEVTELIGLLAEALRARALQPLPLEQSVVYLDPAHTPRLPTRAQAARQVAAALTRQPLRQLPWRGARALPIGAVGGLEFTQPALAAQLTSARLDEAAATGADILVTEDPLALHHLSQRAMGRFRVEGLYELLAQQLA
jgi:Fe-S oxidoreductase